MTRPISRSYPRAAAAWLRAGALVAIIAATLLFDAAGASATENTITQPDSGGQYTSLKLDSSGFPVVSFYDPATHDVKVLHCGDSTCASGNTTATPDPTTMTPVGHTSLVLAGNTPVVTHYDSGPRDLKLVHCGNPLCSSPTIRTLNSGMTDNVGIFADVAINGSGNPVVAYYTEPYDILKVLVCGDPTCTTSPSQNVDSTAITGLYVSLALDASGFPVVSYYNQSNADLRVAHCGNASCSAMNTLVTVDGALVDAGKYTSLALDALGFPVISYYDETYGNLKIVHCGDATCSMNNTIRTPDSTGNVGQHTSLALDAAGSPVVSYYDATNAKLKVLHCGDTTCTSGNTITVPDNSGSVGQYSSLALDSDGNPVVSYYDATDGKLNVLHCGDANCSAPAPTPTPTSSPTPAPVGGFTELTQAVDPMGGRRSFPDAAVVIAGAVAIALAGYGLARRKRSAR